SEADPQTHRRGARGGLRVVGSGVLSRRPHHRRGGAGSGRAAARRPQHLRSDEPLDTGGVTIEARAAAAADGAGGLAGGPAAAAGLGPWAGFVAGWLYWYFWIIVVPVEAIAGARILHDWLGLPAWLLGLVLMGIMTAVNLMSARSYGEFEFWFASIKVAAIIVFIALAAAFACGLTAPTGPTFSNLTAYGGFSPKGFLAVPACAVTVSSPPSG